MISYVFIDVLFRNQFSYYFKFNITSDFLFFFFFCQNKVLFIYFFLEMSYLFIIFFLISVLFIYSILYD